MRSESTTKIISKGKVMARNSILGYYPYTLFQTLPISQMVACSSSLCLTSFIAVIAVLFRPTKVLFYFTPSEGEANIGRGHPFRSKSFGVLLLFDRYPEGAVLIAGADGIFLFLQPCITYASQLLLCMLGGSR